MNFDASINRVIIHPWLESKGAVRHVMYKSATEHGMNFYEYQGKFFTQDACCEFIMKQEFSPQPTEEK